MSRKEMYNEEYLIKLWNEFQGSNKKLKEFCKDGKLKYNSIYTALRKKRIMNSLKEGKNKAVVATTITTPEPVKA